MGQFPGRAAGAVGDADIGWFEGDEILHGLEKTFRSPPIFRWEKLEAEADFLAVENMGDVHTGQTLGNEIRYSFAQ